MKVEDIDKDLDALLKRIKDLDKYLIDNYFRSFDIETVNLNDYKIFEELKIFDETIITILKKNK